MVSAAMKVSTLMIVTVLSIIRSVKRRLIPAKLVSVTAKWSGVPVAICLQMVGRKLLQRSMVLTLRYLRISFTLDITSLQLLSKVTLRSMLLLKLVPACNGLGVSQLRRLLTESLLFVTRQVSKVGLKSRVIDWPARLKLWVVFKNVMMTYKFEIFKVFIIFIYVRGF